jgi:hypothetical protein
MAGEAQHTSLVHERTLDRDEGNAIHERKRLPAAVIQHPADLVTDAAGQWAAMLERNMIDAAVSVLQRHCKSASNGDPLRICCKPLNQEHF